MPRLLPGKTPPGKYGAYRMGRRHFPSAMLRMTQLRASVEVDDIVGNAWWRRTLRLSLAESNPWPTRCPSPRLFQTRGYDLAPPPLHELESETSSAVAVLLYMNHRRRSIITIGRIAISTMIRPRAATPIACSSHYGTYITSGQQKRLLALPNMLLPLLRPHAVTPYDHAELSLP